MTITESAESSFVTRTCRCPRGSFCPRDLRLASSRVETRRGAFYLMECQWRHQWMKERGNCSPNQEVNLGWVRSWVTQNQKILHSSVYEYHTMFHIPIFTSIHDVHVNWIQPWTFYQTELSQLEFRHVQLHNSLLLFWSLHLSGNTISPKASNTCQNPVSIDVWYKQYTRYHRYTDTNLMSLSYFLCLPAITTHELKIGMIVIWSFVCIKMRKLKLTQMLIICLDNKVR